MPEVNLDHTVKTETINIRLDLYLRTIGVRLSRNRLNMLIQDGRVSVNGKPSKPSYKVKTGDHIIVTYNRLTHDDIEAEDIPLTILYEDEHIIIINKQKNIVVHPAKGNRGGTMVNALLYHTEISGGEKSRPGVVHRLDKDTTGAMVFAKTPEAHTNLSMQIERREINRIYFSVVWGEIVRKYIKIDEPIGSNLSNRKLIAVTPVNSKNAITIINKIQDYKIATALKIKLHTGRTHQIRVHLSHLGHPVIGDDYYGTYAKSAIKDLDIDIKKHFDNINSLMERQALHSASLGLHHPVTNEYMVFYAPLPDDMIILMNYLNNLKREN